MAQSFMDRMLSPFEFNKEITEDDKKKIGTKHLQNLLKDCRYEGERVGDLKGKKLDKALLAISRGIMKKTSLVCESAYLIGGDLREEVADIALDHASGSSDVMFGIQCASFDPDGQHTTVTKFPHNTLAGENVLSMLHSLVRDVAGRVFDITDPKDLHVLMYNMLMLMAVIEAKTMARVYMKNIDYAALLENPHVGALVEKSENGETPMCPKLKGRDFFKTICEGNSHRDELEKAMREEQKIIDKEFGDNSFTTDW